MPMWVFAAFLLFTSTSVNLAKTSQKPAVSNQEKPEAILAAAKKASETRAWRVDARIEGDKQMNISGIVAGNDFDLTVETVDGTKRQITLGEKSWVSEDGGKNWKNADANDRRFYYLVHTPIKFSSDQKIPPHEKVAPEKGEAANLLHVRLKAQEKIHYEGDRPNWWIALEDGKPTVIHRYHGPGVLEKSYVTTDATYTQITDQPPVVAPPGNPHALAAEPGPENLLMAAMKKMNDGVWEVRGTASLSKTVKAHGLFAGKDFDLTIDPEDGSPAQRIIMIGKKAWASGDGGKSFHSGTPDDRLLYTLVHTPILSGRLEPPFEKVDAEQGEGANWLHIRLKVNEKTEETNLPQYWLVLDAQGQASYIGRASVPVINPNTNNVIRCDFEYAPSKTVIAPPAAERMKPAGSNATPQGAEEKPQSLSAPVDDKVHGFNDIEQHKFEWAGKIVRIEVTPKLLQAQQIGEDTYRAFLKDSVSPKLSYGQVEFPGEALVTLGFLKKTLPGLHGWTEYEKGGLLGRTEGEPVSFYVEVIPIGEKPAARTVAVGAKLVQNPDGSVSYTWDSSQPSPAAARVSDESDEDLVNRGIEKAKNGDLDGALADFDRAVKTNPKDDAPYYNRAQAKWLKKDAPGAIADYTRAIELGSTNPAAYNNRGNARAENNDRDGAIADYTRAIELKPNYARAYYNRGVAKKEKGDTAGAKADFKAAEKLDPELASEESAADSKNNRPLGATTVSLLDGKLKLDLPGDFSRDSHDPKDPKTLAKFSGPDGAWGAVLRGTHGLTPEKLEGYLKMRVAEYSKGFKWLPKDSHLQWLKKEIVTIDGHKWADWRYVPMLKGKKDYSHNPVYTRLLTTSYKGQLLEINFTSNLNTEPKLKEEIDQIMASVHLEE
jgi:tetratricopeptide (TPR) repeat protein